MPTFDFQARDSNGKSVSGKRLAQSADSLSAQLFREGITPIRITLTKEMSSLWRQLQNKATAGRVDTDELSIFSRQMNTLCKTGVSITASLKQLADDARSMRMTQVLLGVVEYLESGLDLAGAMQKFPDVFSSLMVSMIRVGQSSGKLDEAFLYLNHYLELEASTLKRVKMAMRYPSFVLIAIITAIVMLNIFVIPTFANVFKGANIALPTLTVYMMQFSDFFKEYGILLAILLGCLVTAGIYYIKSPNGSLQYGEYVFRIPFIGKILRRVVLLRFSQVFAVTIQSGIPLLEGLDLVQEATTNAYARNEIHCIKLAIQRGNSLSQAVHASRLFTSLELQMFAVSEETGELGPMLEHIGLFYQREVDYDLRRLNDIIEPLLIVALAAMIMILAFAVYLPIWNMIKLVHF